MTACDLESTSLTSDAEMPGNQVGEQNIRHEAIRDFRSQERGRLQSDSLAAPHGEIAPTEDKHNRGFERLEPKINAAQETLQDQGRGEESSTTFEVLENMLQDTSGAVADQTTKSLKLRLRFFGTEEHSGTAGERHLSESVDEGYRSGTDQRLSASDRLREHPDERTFEVKTCRCLVEEKSTLEESLRHTHAPVALELHSAREQIER